MGKRTEARDKLQSSREEMSGLNMCWWGQKEVGRFWKYWEKELTKMPFCSPGKKRVYSARGLNGCGV